MKLDTKAKKLSDGIAVTALAGATLSASADSLWVVSDSKTTTLANRSREKRGRRRDQAACWLSFCRFRRGSRLGCLPRGRQVVAHSPADQPGGTTDRGAGAPAAVAIGEGSVWVLTEREGKVARVDPKSNKVTATIELKAPLQWIDRDRRRCGLGKRSGFPADANRPGD